MVPAETPAEALSSVLVAIISQSSATVPVTSCVSCSQFILPSLASHSRDYLLPSIQSSSLFLNPYPSLYLLRSSVETGRPLLTVTERKTWKFPERASRNFPLCRQYSHIDALRKLCIMQMRGVALPPVSCRFEEILSWFIVIRFSSVVSAGDIVPISFPLRSASVS